MMPYLPQAPVQDSKSYRSRVLPGPIPSSHKGNGQLYTSTLTIRWDIAVIRVGIVGAAGYAGGELMRLLVGHEGVLLTNLVSRTHAGKSVSQVYPGYYGYDLPHFQELSADELADGCDVVFLASPSGTAWPLIKEMCIRDSSSPTDRTRFHQ